LLSRLPIPPGYEISGLGSARYGRHGGRLTLRDWRQSARRAKWRHGRGQTSGGGASTRHWRKRGRNIWRYWRKAARRRRRRCGGRVAGRVINPCLRRQRRKGWRKRGHGARGHGRRKVPRKRRHGWRDWRRRHGHGGKRRRNNSTSVQKRGGFSRRAHFLSSTGPGRGGCGRGQHRGGWRVVASIGVAGGRGAPTPGAIRRETPRFC